MKKYAIIKLQGHQYQVSENDEILVDKMSEGKELEVLLFVDGDKVKVGKPTLKDVSIKIKVINEEKGDKIKVFKFKSKSRYRRHRGFRAQYTRLLVEKISSK
ncbi:50S ribosomal protein L21 [Patescibacteria group bacterium]|nr:50S ribosomal protein L21 [Patescibacteria group bacterium]